MAAESWILSTFSQWPVVAFTHFSFLKFEEFLRDSVPLTCKWFEGFKLSSIIRSKSVDVD
jgi:hypothetical protein